MHASCLKVLDKMLNLASHFEKIPAISVYSNIRNLRKKLLFKNKSALFYPYPHLRDFKYSALQKNRNKQFG